MKKRNKLGAKKWVEAIKASSTPNQSKQQPYHPIFIPWAIRQYMKKKGFQPMSSKHPSFKNQGGKNIFLLDRARFAMKNGYYEQPWITKDESE